MAVVTGVVAMTATLGGLPANAAESSYPLSDGYIFKTPTIGPIIEPQATNEEEFVCPEKTVSVADCRLNVRVNGPTYNTGGEYSLRKDQTATDQPPSIFAVFRLSYFDGRSDTSTTELTLATSMLTEKYDETGKTPVLASMKLSQFYFDSFDDKDHDSWRTQFDSFINANAAYSFTVCKNPDRQDDSADTDSNLEPNYTKIYDKEFFCMTKMTQRTQKQLGGFPDGRKPFTQTSQIKFITVDIMSGFIATKPAGRAILAPFNDNFAGMESAGCKAIGGLDLTPTTQGSYLGDTQTPRGPSTARVMTYKAPGWKLPDESCYMNNPNRYQVVHFNAGAGGAPTFADGALGDGISGVIGDADAVPKTGEDGDGDIGGGAGGTAPGEGDPSGGGAGGIGDGAGGSAGGAEDPDAEHVFPGRDDGEDAKGPEECVNGTPGPDFKVDVPCLVGSLFTPSASKLGEIDALHKDMMSRQPFSYFTTATESAKMIFSPKGQCAPRELAVMTVKIQIWRCDPDIRAVLRPASFWASSLLVAALVGGWVFRRFTPEFE